LINCAFRARCAGFRVEFVSKCTCRTLNTVFQSVVEIVTLFTWIIGVKDWEVMGISDYSESKRLERKEDQD